MEFSENNKRYFFRMFFQKCEFCILGNWFIAKIIWFLHWGGGHCYSKWQLIKHRSPVCLFVYLFGFIGNSTLEGYLMQNPFLYKWTVLFQVIQFSKSTHFSSISPIDRTLSGATAPGQSGPGGDDNEGVLRIPQSFSITGITPSDCLVLYPGRTLEGVLPFCRSVFSSLSQLGTRTEVSQYFLKTDKCKSQSQWRSMTVSFSLIRHMVWCSLRRATDNHQVSLTLCLRYPKNA